MTYILGHNPDEFGLVPNEEGFIALKELLWALHEESDWSYVRQGNINEVLLSEDRTSFEVKDKSIRSSIRNWQLNLDLPVEEIPPILYVPIRRKAHYTALDRGLNVAEGNPYVLSPHRDMAEMIGKRRDKKPVILEIMAGMAKEEGILFYSFGKLFLTMEIFPKYMAGPPVPKDTLKQREEKTPKKQGISADFNAGAFILDSTRDPDGNRRRKGKKKKGWKEESKAMRRRDRA